VLKHVVEIQTPSRALADQVVAILADDNIYYDARIIASNALIQLLKKIESSDRDDIQARLQKVIQKIKSTPQPPFFDQAVDRLDAEIFASGTLVN